MLLKELTTHKNLENKVRCVSCRKKHLVGERSCIKLNNKWLDYCPGCLKSRTYYELKNEKKGFLNKGKELEL